MCAGFRATLCVHVPCVLRVAHETLHAVARVCGVHVSLLRDMVQCVSRRLLWCPCDVVLCDWGAALDTEGKTHCLPTLRGSTQRVATPDTYFRPPGRPCRKESQTFSLIPFRILWIATAVGCQSTHARLRSPSRGEQPALLQLALLEPETAAGNRPRVYKSPSSPRPLQATGPVSTKALWIPRPLQATGPVSTKDPHPVL